MHDTFHVEADGDRKWCAVAVNDDTLTVGIGDSERAALIDLRDQVGNVGRGRPSASERRRLWKLLRMRAARTAGVWLTEVA